MEGAPEEVSWLEAASLAFPGGYAQWHVERAFRRRPKVALAPLTVAGPRRILTGLPWSPAPMTQDCPQCIPPT
jgi:hypothetical protein